MPITAALESAPSHVKPLADLVSQGGVAHLQRYFTHRLRVKRCPQVAYNTGNLDRCQRRKLGEAVRTARNHLSSADKSLTVEAGILEPPVKAPTSQNLLMIYPVISYPRRTLKISGRP